jgi:hypothetical protein
MDLLNSPSIAGQCDPLDIRWIAVKMNARIRRPAELKGESQVAIPIWRR